MKYYYDVDGNSIRFPDLDEEHRKVLIMSASNYIRKYAYDHGNYIYKFMEKYNVGHSNYGKLMDAAGRGKGVMAHRLYGHHVLYDFPINDIENIKPFIKHLGSDIFTKQGLPIIPGEILEDVGLKQCCGNLTKNWNFINGFDILSATVAIYYGYQHIKKYVCVDNEINNIEELASTLGVGTLNLAIALSTANPFLFVGGILSFVAGIKGILNDGSRVFFDKNFRYLTVDHCIETLDVEKTIKRFDLDCVIDKYAIRINQYNIDNEYIKRGDKSMNNDEKQMVKIKVDAIIDEYSVGFIKGVKEAVINAKKDWSSWCKKDRDKLNFALYNLLSDSRVHSEEFFKNVDILWDLSMPKKIELEELIDVLINPSKYREDKKYENLVTLIIKGVLPGAMSSFELFNLLKNSIDISKIFADYCKSLREYCYELIDANEQ